MVLPAYTAVGVTWHCIIGKVLWDTLGCKILCTIASVWSKTILNTGGVGRVGVCENTKGELSASYEYFGTPQPLPCCL